MGVLWLEVGCWSELLLFCWVWGCVCVCVCDVFELRNISIFIDVFRLPRLDFMNVQQKLTDPFQFYKHFVLYCIVFYAILGMDVCVCLYSVQFSFYSGLVRLFIKNAVFI